MALLRRQRVQGFRRLGLQRLEHGVPIPLQFPHVLLLGAQGGQLLLGGIARFFQLRQASLQFGQRHSFGRKRLLVLGPASIRVREPVGPQLRLLGRVPPSTWPL